MTENYLPPAAPLNRKLLALEFLLVFLVLFLPLQACLDAAKFTIFTARDLDRAQLLAAGRLILFGPEASGGGHLPGSFYYFLMAAPLKLGLGWKAVWELQFALAAAGFSLLWLFIRLRLGALPAYYALFCAAFFDSKVFFFAYNASFLPLFVVAALADLCAAFDERSERRGLALVVFALSSALGLQFHMSFALLPLSALILQLWAPRLGLKALPWKTFAAGLAVFLAALLPYGIWLASARLGSPIGQPALPFTGASAVELWGILKYSFNARAVLPAQVLADRTMSLLPVEAIVPLLLLYFGFAGRKEQAGPAPEAAGGQRFAGVCVKVLIVTTALNFFTYAMSLGLSPVRYAVIPRLSLDFLTCALLARAQFRLNSGRFYAAVIGTLFVLALAWHLALSRSSLPLFSFSHIVLSAAAGLALAALVRHGEGAGAGRTLPAMALVLPLFLSSALYAGIAGHAQDDTPGSKDLAAMSRVIYSQTGWKYNEARLHLFYVNTRAETTPAYIYRAVEAEGALAPAPGTGLARVNGYFAALFKENGPKQNDLPIKQRLLAQDLPPMLKEGLASGGIRLGSPAQCGRLFLVPYEVTDTERLPAFFHNSSEGYSLTGPGPALIPAAGEKTFRFKFNDCPGHGEWCDIMADVRLRREDAGRWLAYVVFSGEPLAQVCDGVNMQWNQILDRPYLEATCGGKPRRYPLAGSLGMHRDRYRSMNQSVLAPYERAFHVDCRGKLEKIAVGYEAASSYYLTQRLDGMPGKELSAEMDNNAATPRR